MSAVPGVQEVQRQQQQLSTAAVDRDAALSRLLELEAAVAAAVEERRLESINMLVH